MISVQQLYESWGKISRDLYIHKLVKSNSAVDSDLELLKSEGIIDDIKDVYIYSFVHPDTNQVVSFTGKRALSPGKYIKLFISSLSPSRVVAYKGLNISQEFSGEKIMSNEFSTTGYLFTGKNATFKKVAAIPTKIISTNVPIPLPLSVIVYEKYEIDCDDNKFNINSFNIKRFKAWSVPQMLTKSNYLYTYECKIE